MSKAIQFLESLGERRAPLAAEYAAIVAGLGVGDAQRQALLDRDYSALNGLLDGRAKMVFAVNLPSPYEQETDPGDKDGDGVPDQDESPHEKE